MAHMIHTDTLDATFTVSDTTTETTFIAAAKAAEVTGLTADCAAAVLFLSDRFKGTKGRGDLKVAKGIRRVGEAAGISAASLTRYIAAGKAIMVYWPKLSEDGRKAILASGEPAETLKTTLVSLAGASTRAAVVALVDPKGVDRATKSLDKATEPKEAKGVKAPKVEAPSEAPTEAPAEAPAINLASMTVDQLLMLKAAIEVELDARAAVPAIAAA